MRVLKRLVILPILLCAGFLIVLFFGRTPSNYAIEDEAARFHEERRSRHFLLTREIARVELARRQGAQTGNDVARMKGELAEYLRTPRRANLGGWEALFLPAGATRPGSEGWYVWGELDPSAPQDDIEIRMKVVVWLRPNGSLARAAVALGLAP